ncbi:MAG: T9SS type A sorting domain-containing protein [Melioribacteraceae bacterium]|nr:T9SS type A sorting domain-containing protein [Melioribacteraceae bacterium]
MKKFIYYLSFLMFAVITSQITAQSELIIHATPNSLDAVIKADQDSGSPHDIYTLVSLDTTYVFDEGIIIDNSIVIRGVAGADGKLPTIQPGVDLEGNVAPHLFTFTKDESVIKLENLYLLGVSYNNTVDLGDGYGVTVNGNNIKTYIDNVVFEQWTQFSVNFSGDWNSFWVTNCKFRNSVNSGSVYTGQAFRQRNDLGTTLVDTIVMKYNTFFATNAYAMCSPVTGHLNYGEFSHNTVAAMVKNPLFSMNATNMKIAHNIFYDTYASGMSNGEFPWWDRIWAGGLSSTIDFDPLNKLNAYLAGIDTNAVDWSVQAEAIRTIDVIDNIYYRSPEIDAFIASVNDTASTANDTIHLTPWMNEVTTNMFADDSQWPGFNDEGNKFVDPGFGDKYAEILGASGTVIPAENGIGMLPYITLARANGGTANDQFGYNYSQPDGLEDWVPTWPLPEFTDEVLKYTADLTAIDGMVYGDPFWFTGVTDVEQINSVPTEYSLEQNYPNPFNPSTVIEYSLQKAGLVNLSVFNILGEEVATLVNLEQGTGSYKVNFNAVNFTSGIYFYTLSTNSVLLTKKMILIK